MALNICFGCHHLDPVVTLSVWCWGNKEGAVSGGVVHSEWWIILWKAIRLRSYRKKLSSVGRTKCKLYKLRPSLFCRQSAWAAQHCCTLRNALEWSLAENPAGGEKGHGRADSALPYFIVTFPLWCQFLSHTLPSGSSLFSIWVNRVNMLKSLLFKWWI